MTAAKTINCTRCGGPTSGQHIFQGNHRHLPDCISFLKRYISELEPRAAFGDQCYQDRCENAYVEQSVVKRMDFEISRLMDVQRLNQQDIALLQKMQELGITDQDIHDTMPPKPCEER
jgi:hypothetical protein